MQVCIPLILSPPPAPSHCLLSKPTSWLCPSLLIQDLSTSSEIVQISSILSTTISNFAEMVRLDSSTIITLLIGVTCVSVLPPDGRWIILPRSKCRCRILLEKELNQKKYLSPTVQSLEWYATQSFDNNGLVGRVHFDVTPCDVWHGNGDEDNDDVDEMT